jgi:hypothetical protein
MLEHSAGNSLEPAQQDSWRNGLQTHSEAIVSICFTPSVTDGVLVVAVNPLFYGSSALFYHP